MRFSLGILFLCQFGLAGTEQEQLASLLTNWKTEQSKSIAPLEALFRASKSQEIKNQIALVLAYVPEAQLQQKPHSYAHYAIESKRDIPDPFSLYRIAGDGFYQNQEFLKASGIYTKASVLPSISNQDRDYFRYKNAWTYLNLKNPRKAFAILSLALKQSATDVLRQPMITDLGRIFGEGALEKNELPPKKEWFTPSSPSEAQWFVEGIGKAFQRSPQKFSKFYEISFQQPWMEGAIPFVFEVEDVIARGACEVMKMRESMHSSVQKNIRLLPYISLCAEKLLNELSTPQKAYLDVAKWFAMFELDVLQTWTLQKLFSKSKNTILACRGATENVEKITRQQPLWLITWLQESALDCKNADRLKDFEEKLSLQHEAWPKGEAQVSLLAIPELSYSLKLSILKNWSAVLSQKEAQNLLAELAKTVSVKEGSDLLIENCPTTASVCLGLWEQKSRESLDWIRYWLDSDKIPSVKDHAILAAWLTLRAQINDPSTVLNELEISKTLQPVGEDIRNLQAMEKNREALKSLEEASDEVFLQKLSHFQDQAKELARVAWTTQLTKSRAQQEVAKTAQLWQDQLQQRGKTADERAQWRQLAKIVHKWSRL